MTRFIVYAITLLLLCPSAFGQFTYLKRTNWLGESRTIINSNFEYIASMPSTSVAARITATDTSQWHTAYGWGDHSTNNYGTGSVGSLSGVATGTPLYVVADISNMWHVSKCGAATNSGKSWANAKLTVQGAVEVANAVGSYNDRQAIHVASGTYSENIAITNPYVYLIGQARKDAPIITTTTGTVLTLSGGGGYVSGMEIKNYSSAGGLHVNGEGTYVLHDLKVEANTTNSTGITVLLEGGGKTEMFHTEFEADVTFNGLTGAGQMIMISGASTRVHMYNPEIYADLTTVNCTNMYLAAIRDYSTNEVVIFAPHTEVSVDGANFSGRHVFYKHSSSGTDKNIGHGHIHLTCNSTNDSVKVAAFEMDTASGKLRSTYNTVKINDTAQAESRFLATLTNGVTFVTVCDDIDQAPGGVDDLGDGNTIKIANLSPGDGIDQSDFISLGGVTRGTWPTMGRPSSAAALSTTYLDLGTPDYLASSAGYNNIASANGSISDMEDTDGYNTGIKAELSGWRGVDDNGYTTHNFGYDTNAVRDSHQAYKTATATLILTNLTDDVTYTNTFVCSRDASGGQTAERFMLIWDTAGITTQTVQFATNIDTVVSMVGTAANSKITFELASAGNYYGYLNLVEIEYYASGEESDPVWSSVSNEYARTFTAIDSSSNYIEISQSTDGNFDYCVTNGAGATAYTNLFEGSATTGSVTSAGAATNVYLDEGGVWQAWPASVAGGGTDTGAVAKVGGTNGVMTGTLTLDGASKTTPPMYFTSPSNQIIITSGDPAMQFSTNIASAFNSVIIGSVSNVGPSYARGRNSVRIGMNQHADDDADANEVNKIVIGYGANAKDAKQCTVIGTTAGPPADDHGVNIGLNSVGSQVAIGYNSGAGAASVCIGEGAGGKDGATAGVYIGDVVQGEMAAADNWNVAIGQDADCKAQAVAIGFDADAGYKSVHVGFGWDNDNQHAARSNNVEIGYRAIAEHHAVAIGSGVSNHLANSAMIGGVSTYVLHIRQDDTNNLYVINGASTGTVAITW